MRLLLMMLMLAFAPLLASPVPEGATKIRARVTYYHDGGQVACPNTKRSKVGVTVAAHPKFSFGTKVIIPDLGGTYIVQDRGPAVTRKVASKGKAYVFDVYVSSRAEVKRLAKQKPAYMDVWTYK